MRGPLVNNTHSEDHISQFPELGICTMCAANHWSWEQWFVVCCSVETLAYYNKHSLAYAFSQYVELPSVALIQIPENTSLFYTISLL